MQMEYDHYGHCSTSTILLNIICSTMDDVLALQKSEISAMHHAQICSAVEVNASYQRQPEPAQIQMRNAGHATCKVGGCSKHTSKAASIQLVKGEL